ncbi:unnamed protein product [Cylicocyclus nassatus]|uniref:Uncharacterized protein n=1 Tax=Cylicocyclus nassatus TaxID=53992 RepID=A0AA36MEB3_CYLNA|nr:unnamed protein product [Cylicocyclus nassatus]
MASSEYLGGIMRPVLELYQSSTVCYHSVDRQSGAVKMTKIWLILLISHPIAGKLFVEENAQLKESNSGMCSLSGPTNHQLPPSELAAFWHTVSLPTPPPAILGILVLDISKIKPILVQQIRTPRENDERQPIS